MLRPLEAAPLPMKVTVLPTSTAASDALALAVGCVPVAAADTAAPASSRPAPQVDVVQMHSSCDTRSGAWQTLTSGSVLVVGNGRALLFSRLTTCAGVSDGLIDRISA